MERQWVAMAISSDAVFIRQVLIVFGLAALAAALWLLSDILLLLFGSIIFARTQTGEKNVAT